MSISAIPTAAPSDPIGNFRGYNRLRSPDFASGEWTGPRRSSSRRNGWIRDRVFAALTRVRDRWFEITSVKVVEILGGHVVSGLGRDFGEGGGLVVAEAIHCLLRHVAML